jgi:hypothetical protein
MAFFLHAIGNSVHRFIWAKCVETWPGDFFSLNADIHWTWPKTGNPNAIMAFQDFLRCTRPMLVFKAPKGRLLFISVGTDQRRCGCCRVSIVLHEFHGSNDNAKGTALKTRLPKAYMYIQTLGTECIQGKMIVHDFGQLWHTAINFNLTIDISLIRFIHAFH